MLPILFIRKIICVVIFALLSSSKCLRVMRYKVGVAGKLINLVPSNNPAIALYTLQLQFSFLLTGTLSYSVIVSMLPVNSQAPGGYLISQHTCIGCRKRWAVNLDCQSFPLQRKPHKCLLTVLVTRALGSILGSGSFHAVLLIYETCFF